MARRRPALPAWATPLLCLSLLGACGGALADGLADVQELQRNGKPAEALKRLDGLLNAKPQDPNLRFERGVLLSDLKRNSDAVAVFVKLTRDFPELPEPHNNLAVLYAEAGQMDKAKASLEAAIRSKPNYGTAFQNLGDVYARMASRAYAKALQINEKDAAGAPRLAMMRSLYNPGDAGTGALVASAATAAVSPQASKPAMPPVVVEPPVPPRPALPAASTPAQLAEDARVKAAASADAERKRLAVAAAATAEAERKKAQASAEAERKKNELAAAKDAKEAKEAREAKAAREAEKAQEARGAKDERDVLTAVRGWATAWTRQDMDGYFSRYEPGFAGSEGSAKAWQSARRDRIMGKSGIDISLSNVKIEVRGKEATVTFRQTYEAGALKVSSSKRLSMVLVGGQWLIRKESVG